MAPNPPEDLNAFRALWRRTMAKIQAMTPEERAEMNRRTRVDLPGSGTMTTAEYHAEVRRRAEQADAGPTPVVPVLREAGFGLRHTDPLENRSLAKWPAVSVARAWISLPVPQGGRPEHPFLCLCGPAEMGKTQGAAVAAANWAARSVGPRATGELQPVWLLSAARLAAVPSWEQDPMVEQAAHVRFLVLDDLGAKTLTKSIVAPLYQILDARWAKQKRTVIVSTLPPHELHSRLDWDGAEPKINQLGETWRRISEHWVATVSRASGVLHVRREEERFPAFDMPTQRQRGGR
jgi:hypothetical protein